jgi:predicted RNA-binding protein with RPS1 domain
VFAVAVSDNEAGEDALEWLMSELVEDGDEIVAIRVIELDEDGQCLSLDIFLDNADDVERHNPQQQDDFRAQAHELLQDVLTKNNEADERKVSRTTPFVCTKADHA